MNIHWLQHVPFEGLGSIALWAERNAHTLHPTRLWAGDELPDPESVSFLIVMGGPMGVHDEAVYPWLATEKQFISEVLQRGSSVLGICLGAQLLADRLGTRVYRNDEKEIGWYPVNSEPGLPAPFDDHFAEPVTVFHWHGDTFDLPYGATHLLSSSGCKNQAFSVNSRVIGLQFHLEMTEEGLQAIIENCRDELRPGQWIQGEAEMLDSEGYRENCQGMMNAILDYLAGHHQ